MSSTSTQCKGACASRQHLDEPPVSESDRVGDMSPEWQCAMLKPQRDSAAAEAFLRVVVWPSLHQGIVYPGKFATEPSELIESGCFPGR